MCYLRLCFGVFAHNRREEEEEEDQLALNSAALNRLKYYVFFLR